MRKRLWLLRVSIITTGVLIGAERLGAQQDVLGGGFDLVVLVDVSRSTTDVDRTADVKDDGSDPERIRWDAVQLMLDLLGPTDRVMVQRFNDACPPRLSDRKVTEYLRRKKYFEPLMEFDSQLLALSPTNRKTMAEKIARFNRTDDDSDKYEGYLDFGETQIIGALRVVAERLGRPAVGRSTHVILLTDGLDDDHEKYESNEALRRALSFYVGDEFAGKRVPVHVVGLRLDSEGQERAEQARDLLTRVAHLSGGEFYEVRDSEELILFFLNLVRNLKGYWLDNIKYDPEDHGPEFEAKRLVVNGIIDFGIMSYAVDPNAKPKYRTAPPTHPLELGWERIEEYGYREPKCEKVRTGKDETVYRYFYFGPTADPGTVVGKSPFADFVKPIRVHLKLRGDRKLQKLVLLKGTAKLFRLLQPTLGAVYQRYQTLEIRVAMARSSHFSPDQFEVKARVTSLRMESPQDTTDTDSKEYRLSPKPPEPGRESRDAADFVVRVPLTALPQKAEKDQDLYQLEVTVEGLSEPAAREHALSGNQRELSPRIIAVENSLSLERVPPIELSRAQPLAELKIRTSYPVDQDIELGFQFISPRSKDGPVPRDNFELKSNGKSGASGKLILKKGFGSIEIALLPDKLPQRGVAYEPGMIRMTPPDAVRMTSLEVPIRLRLSLSKVAFHSVPDLLVAQKTEVRSKAISVELSPKDQPRFGTGPLDVRLTPLRKPNVTSKRDSETLQRKPPSREASSDTSASEKGVVERDAVDTFGPQELWLAKGNDEPRSLEGRSQRLRIGLGDEFQIHLHPRGNTASGKYTYLLGVTGDWIDPIETEFAIDIQAPRIELDTDTATIYVAPGQTGRAAFRAWLRGIEQGRQPIYVDGVRSGDRIAFLAQKAGQAGCRLAVRCPDEPHPIDIVSLSAEKSLGRDPDSSSRTQHSGSNSVQSSSDAREGFLSFEVSVPPNTDYGRYVHTFTLVGPDVVRRTVQIIVVVNALECDFGRTGTAMTEWQPRTEANVIQLLDTSMTQSLRIRTGLAEPLRVDNVKVQIVGPFSDDAGDVQRLPSYSTQLIDDGTSLRIDVRFLATPNGNQAGYPYKLKVVSYAPALRVPAVEFTFRIRFLLAKDILEGRDSSIPADVER